MKCFEIMNIVKFDWKTDSGFTQYIVDSSLPTQLVPPMMSFIPT